MTKVQPRSHISVKKKRTLIFSSDDFSFCFWHCKLYDRSAEVFVLHLYLVKIGFVLILNRIFNKYQIQIKAAVSNFLLRLKERKIALLSQKRKINSKFVQFCKVWAVWPFLLWGFVLFYIIADWRQNIRHERRCSCYHWCSSEARIVITVGK